MNTDKDILMYHFLEGDLNDEDERRALHMIADDPEMRALLKFDLQLRQCLSSDILKKQDHPPLLSHTETSVSIPEGFFDGVMGAIAEHDQTDQPDKRKSSSLKESPLSWMITLRNQLWKPRNVAWRPIWSVAIAAALLMIILLSPYITTTLQQPASPVETPAHQIVETTTDRVMMRFVYIDSDAESIAVAGNFSNWEPIELAKQTFNGKVAWTGIVPLPRGEHRYMFIKDGERWTTDPLATRYVDDGFGNKNAIVHL